jgi:GMP synthase (glutamine-hydrolysing)
MRIHVLQHVPYESPGLITDWAKGKGFSISFTRFYETEKLPAPQDIDLVIIMGGPMNIYESDKYPWLVLEKAFLHNCFVARTKLLGICLGSQLLADVLGAKVYRNPEKEIGWFPIYKNGSHPLLKLFPDEAVPALHWHSDTFDLPEGAVPIYSSVATKNQGFIYNNHVFALQFHWEIRPNSLMELILHSDETYEGKYIQTPEKMLNNPVAFNAAKNHLWNLLDYIQKL